MPLDAKAQVLVQAMTQGLAVDPSTLSVAQYRAALARMPLPPSTEPLASIVDRAIPGPGGALALRIYRPLQERDLPATVFLHGGGFVSCGLDSHDNLCRRLARQSGGVVVAVDYRLAPEAPYPAALEDACAAARWLRRAAPALDIDASRIALAGDSAGGNLAAAAAQRLHGEGVALRHQLLFYPALDPDCGSASFAEYGEAGYLLGTGLMRWFWSQYLQRADAALDPGAAPLRAPSLRGLPPATVITAECDPLRDEGEAYAAALRDAGVAVQALRVPGVFHGFASLLGFIEQADAAVAQGAQALREAFAGPPVESA